MFENGNMLPYRVNGHEWRLVNENVDEGIQVETTLSLMGYICEQDLPPKYEIKKYVILL